ncbi:hypothetical protein ACFLZW_04470 [Chloroflexota bacterium]
MIKRFCIVVLIIMLPSSLLACREQPQIALEFDLEKLLLDVFEPLPGEVVLVMVDLPTTQTGDHPAWAARRNMAAQWLAAWQKLGETHNFVVLPLLEYYASGGHNAPLPKAGRMAGQAVALENILAETNIVVALTEFSATASLFEYTTRYPDLRAASMPGVVEAMQESALAADYSQVARRAHILAEKLDRAVGAQVKFSTGQKIYFDLRYRTAHADGGQLHANSGGERIINLPSGEAYIAPYEGERAGEPSQTMGEIPLIISGSCSMGEMIVARVQGNKIVDYIGEGPCAAEARRAIAREPGLANIAELGLGVNPGAVLRGIVLEDEKVVGMHWAYGRSDHLGGVFGVGDFDDPANATHIDIVYPKGGEIEIKSLKLIYEDGDSEQILRNGAYVIFDW